MLLPNVRYFLETNLSSEWPFFLINLSALDDIQRWPKPTLILARDLRLDGCLAFDYNMGTSRTSITGSLTFFFRCLSLSLSRSPLSVSVGIVHTQRVLGNRNEREKTERTRAILKLQWSRFRRLSTFHFFSTLSHETAMCCSTMPKIPRKGAGFRGKSAEIRGSYDRTYISLVFKFSPFF